MIVSAQVFHIMRFTEIACPRKLFLLYYLNISQSTDGDGMFEYSMMMSLQQLDVLQVVQIALADF